MSTILLQAVNLIFSKMFVTLSSIMLVGIITLKALVNEFQEFKLIKKNFEIMIMWDLIVSNSSTSAFSLCKF